jgi:hypothetical protein
MAKNILQVYTANPITVNAPTDLMYFGRSPYGLGDDAGMTFSSFASQFAAPFTPAALTETNDTNVTLTLSGTPATALLQAVNLTLGWTGTLSPARGGTGVNNGTSTLTLGGSLITTGAFSSTFNMTGATNVTFPTSGTLATTSTASGIINAGLINQLAWYAANGTAVSGLSTAPSGVLVTSAASVPSISTTLPNGLAMGTPGSLTLTNATGLPISGITGLGTGVATALGQNVTGSGGIVLANGPTFVTSTITAPSITFSTTSGIIGTTTNNNAPTGSVGEYLTTSSSAVTTSVTSSTATNILSLSLTAGDWNVWGTVTYFGGASTVVALIDSWVSTLSATRPVSEFRQSFLFAAGFTPYGIGGPLSINAPIARISLASTTTVYLQAYSIFTVSTTTAGGAIYARRER